MTNRKIGAGIISSFFVFLCVCTGCSNTASSDNVLAPAKYANGDTLDPIQKTNPESEELELLFPGSDEANEIDNEDLTISISTSTTTPTSQSYTASFSSQTTIYSGNNSTNRTIFIALDDPVSLEDLPTESERLEGLEEGEEDAGPEALTGYVFSITAGVSDPIIPYQYYYGSRANIDITSIGSDIVEEDAVDSINSIYIPSSIETIDPNAFTNLTGKGVTFKLGFDESDKDSFFFDPDEVFPSGCTVVYEGNAAEDRRQGISTTKTSSKDVDLYVGSEETFTKEGYVYSDDLRLGLQYDVYNEEGSYIETRLTYFPVSSTNSNSDTIGKNMGQTSLVMYFDIDMGEGEKINNESLVFFNIYFASNDYSETGGNYFYPDLQYPYTDEDTGELLHTYGQMYCIPRLSYSIEDDISNYIDYSFNSLNTFSGYSAFVMNVKKVDYDVYPNLKKSTYQNNLSSIEDGTLQIRYRLTSLNSAYYRIGYINEDGELDTIDLKVDTPVAYSKINTKRNNELSFLIHNKDIYKGFKVSDIRSVDIVGLRITIDLYNKSRNSIVSKSSVETRFGIVNVMDYTEVAPSFTNINLILILLFVGYTVVFLAATLGLYFYRKNKFKNDEFRRMNTRKFINQAIIAYIFIGLLIFFVATLLFRVMPLNNAVVTYNPIDVYVFFFAIGAIIAVGYYIRYFWLAGKAARHRKEVERLKLNEDEEDDGTGTDIN
ncbi:MAG: hypothetical protein LUC16_00930 [Coprobacillus sp.]|nr:hypothetical protein [Coprobacillus sp.]